MKAHTSSGPLKPAAACTRQHDSSAGFQAPLSGCSLFNRTPRKRVTASRSVRPPVHAGHDSVCLSVARPWSTRLVAVLAELCGNAVQPWSTAVAVAQPTRCARDTHCTPGILWAEDEQTVCTRCASKRLCVARPRSSTRSGMNCNGGGCTESSQKRIARNIRPAPLESAGHTAGRPHC